MSARRRGLLLLALALACGGLAASRVSELERSVMSQVGPTVPVLVSARDVPAGARIAGSALSVSAVPVRYAPPDALAAIQEAEGARAATPLPRGTHVTASRLRVGRGARPSVTLRRGERAVELAVTGGASLAASPPGTRVDVLVSSESAGGAGRTTMALEAVELLATRPAGPADELATGDDGGSSAARPSLLATLRVTLRQAVYLTAAANFAREVRLLGRPPEDRARQGPTSVGAGEL